jgi:KUP system potassium uptake protein
MSQMRAGHAKAGLAALTVGALGVVFGDIGTSPLYTLQTVFTHDNRAVPTSDSAIYGVVSLVFWTLTLVVCVKYVTFIMRADNDREGGIMALIALVQRSPARRRMAGAALVALGIFGASLFYGDGMITPAISVLSAVEGLKVVDEGLEHVVIPITLAILTLLFSIQRFGTHAVGRAFGPVMSLWFAVLALCGLREVAEHPGILRALSPTYGSTFLFEHGQTAFVALGGVVLAVTGAEALYADMGHFGRSPIRRAWFFLVFPSLVLNYMGQGALILRDPEAVRNPFFLLVPDWGRMPMVLLATVATVIASQAVISGAFSITRQAVRLGFLPRLTVRHTSAEEIGQVYVPAVNWLLFAAVVGLVVGFGSSEHLASAYGIAVTGTMTTTTLLFFYVVRTLWRKPLWLSLLGAAAFLVVDLGFFAANLTKVVHGGWFPLLVAVLVFVVLTTWQRGREIVSRNRVEEEGPLRAFVEELRKRDPYRAPGTGVFLNANPDTTPLAMRGTVEHLNTLHQSVVIVSLETTNVPHVAPDDRLEIDDLGYRDDGILKVVARFGFQDATNVPEIVRMATQRDIECEVELDRLTYYLSRITIVVSDAPGMARWRKRLFLAVARNAGNPVEYFKLPDERTVEVGSHIPI